MSLASKGGASLVSSKASAGAAALSRLPEKPLFSSFFPFQVLRATREGPMCQKPCLSFIKPQLFSILGHFRMGRGGLDSELLNRSSWQELLKNEVSYFGNCVAGTKHECLVIGFQREGHRKERGQPPCPVPARDFSGIHNCAPFTPPWGANRASKVMSDIDSALNGVK